MSENKKIRIQEELQIQMIKFFLKTSIPRSIKEKKKNSLSKTQRMED